MNMRSLNSEPYIFVHRIPYEEPYHTQLEFAASNGLYSGRTDFYCNVSSLAEIGSALREFRGKLGDEYKYEIGSEEPENKDYRYFLLRAYTFDSVGHSAIQIAINANSIEPHDGSCKFTIIADPAAINRLGELFEGFSKLEHQDLKWTLKDGELL